MSTVEKFGDFAKKIIKENAPAIAPVKPQVKPATKPGPAPTRPPMPTIMPRPKANAPAVKPIIKPRVKPGPSPTRPPMPTIMPRPKANAPAVKPIIKPRVKPGPSPTRPPMPTIMPRPKAAADELAKVLLRFNYLVRSGAGKLEESMDGKGIPKDALDKIKGTFGTGGMNIAAAHGSAAKELSSKIRGLEAQMDKEELKATAMEIVSRQFPENGIGMRFSDLVWDIEFVSEQEAGRYMMGDDHLVRKSNSISIYPDKTKDAIYKKRVMNMITQGAALKTTEYFFDPKCEDAVDKLAPGLVQSYMSFFKSSQKSNQAMPEGDELKKILTDKRNPQMFTGIMEIVPSADNYTIKVRAINLFFLIHEMTKGVYEMMSLHGLQYDEKTAYAMRDESDTLFDEMYGFKYGAGLVSLFDEFYDRIETELIRSADIHEHNPAVKPALLSKMYNQQVLNDKQFLNMIQLIFKGKPDENTIRKTKELYLLVVDESKQRLEDEAEYARQNDIINNTDLDGVDISGLTGGSDATLGDDTPFNFDDDDEDEPQAAAPAQQDAGSLDMDDILDQISASGFASLSPAQKAVLAAQNESKEVKLFSTFLNESKVKKDAKPSRLTRRIAFLEKKLQRPSLPLHEKSLTEAELIQLRKKVK